MTRWLVLSAGVLLLAIGAVWAIGPIRAFYGALAVPLYMAAIAVAIGLAWWLQWWAY